ncbi:hypothetical protein LINGRAHAP2_LOCUS31157 [Linum grandiflorum]
MKAWMMDLLLLLSIWEDIAASHLGKCCWSLLFYCWFCLSS